MLTNTIEIGTARRLLRRMTRAARTAVSPRAPIPVAFALAVLAVLATVAPEQAAAQTVTTFISNSGQTATASTNAIRATAFTTGTGTYTLSSVGIRVTTQGFGTNPTPLVQIYGDTGGNPGTLVATMTNPGTITDNALNIYTAPANTTLSASTTYWVVTSNSRNSGGTGFEVPRTTSTSLDSGTAAGWSLGNARWRNDHTLPWATSTYRILFQIRGTEQTTTPTNAAPVFADTTLTRSIAENTAADANVGAVIPVATDTDSGDTLTYTMEGTDAARVQLQRNDAADHHESGRDLRLRSEVQLLGDHKGHRRNRHRHRRCDDHPHGRERAAVGARRADRGGDFRLDHEP